LPGGKCLAHRQKRTRLGVVLGHFCRAKYGNFSRAPKLKLARAALIHLSLAVHREEWRQGNRPVLTAPLRLDMLEDDWK